MLTTALITSLLAAAPAVHGLAALIKPSGSPRTRAARAYAAAQTAALFAVAAAALLACAVAIGGPASLTLFADAPYALGLRADALSVTVLAVIGVVGAVCVRFSRAYLDGDPRGAIFFRRMAATLGAASLLVLSGTFATLILGWVAASLMLHGLLVFREERPQAQAVARKKFIAARLSDFCLMIGAISLFLAYGETEFGALNAAAEAGPGGWAAVLGAFAIAAAAIFKSAQFPFHGWLVEVMETPTPVSALLHAGIVNAGGFLLIRLSPVMAAQETALALLLVVGLLTAVAGTFAMMTQTAAKGALAWSTVSQMGLMIAQCGLGAFSAALVHMVAHAAYKAHAFLSAGSAVETVRAMRPRSRDRRASWPMGLGALALAGGVFAAAVLAGDALGFAVAEEPGFILAAAVMTAGLAQFLFAAGAVGRAVPRRALFALPGVAAAYVLIQETGLRITAGVTPGFVEIGLFAVILVAAAIAALALAALIQGGLVRARALEPLRRAAARGFYVDAFRDAVVDRVSARTAHALRRAIEGAN